MCRITTTIGWGLPINTESLMRGLVAYHNYSASLRTLHELSSVEASYLSRLPAEITNEIGSHLKDSAWALAERTMDNDYHHLLKHCDCRLYAQSRVPGMPEGYHEPTVRSVCENISWCEWMDWMAYYKEVEAQDKDGLTMAKRYLPDFGVKVFMDLDHINYNLHVQPLAEMKQAHTTLVYIPVYDHTKSEPRWRPDCDACAICNPVESVLGMRYRPNIPLWEGEERNAPSLVEAFGGRVKEWRRLKEGVFDELIKELKLRPGRWSGTKEVWGEFWRKCFRPLFGGFNGTRVLASPWGGKTGNTWVGYNGSGWNKKGDWIGPDPDVPIDEEYEPKGDWEKDCLVDGKVVRDTLVIRRAVECNCTMWNFGEFDYN